MITKMLLPGFWTKNYLWQIGIFAFLTFFINWALFYEHLIPFPFIAAGFSILLLYFWANNWFLHRWVNLPEKNFRQKLFLTSLMIRIAAVFFFYYFFDQQTGVPFEYNAVDSHFYHETATRIAINFSKFNFNLDQYAKGIKFSDMGFNIYLGAIYTLFGPSLLISRCIGALLSTCTVVFIYKICTSVDDQPIAAKTAGIASMLLPNFLIYLGTQLKETVMVFIIVSIILLSISILKHRQRSFTNIALLLFLLFFLFMFRTILASVAVAALAGYGFFGNPLKTRILNRALTILLLAAFMILVFYSQIGYEINEFITKAASEQTHNMQFRAERDYGNKYALLAGAPLFISMILIAPFPSFIYVPFQEFIWLFISANFIRNIYAFFAIAGLVYCIRYNFRNASILIIYTIGYLLILAKSPFAISERFHLPAVPGLIILSAMGITRYGHFLKKYFIWYLILICLLITGWNYIKMTGRM